jgi:RNA polymerase sigma factor (sigma-70 family)
MGPFSTDTLEAADALPEVPTRRAAGVRERVAAHALAADLARLHGDALLRTARRNSVSADDALDAYQRAMELLLEHAPTIDRAKAVAWMHVVVRREARALRRQQERNVPLEGDDVEEALLRLSEGSEEQLHAIDLAQRAGEVLASLKEAEAQALCLRAQGMSYDEIAELYGWSYTKVNRAVTEGRKAFVDHYRAVESGVVCGDTAELIGRYVAGELRPRLALKVRTHLLRCSGCRALLHAERGADTALRVLLPPVFIAAVASRRTGVSGWLNDHLMVPLGHAAGRLQPAADHLGGGKLAVVAASTFALAGGGVAVEEHARSTHHHTKTPTTLVSEPTASTGAQADNGIDRVVTAATDRTQTLSDQARKRAAATAAAKKRKAAAAKKRKAAAKAQQAKNAREFAPKAAEFASSTRTATKRAKQTTTAPASTASAPTTEVPVDTASNDSTVDVVTENAPTSSSASDEFGN